MHSTNIDSLVKNVYEIDEIDYNKYASIKMVIIKGRYNGMRCRMGLIHIICGDGKGKTTAAMGLSIRAAGRDHRVLIARFMKDNNSGELEVLKNIENITMIPITKTFGFTWNMTQEKKEEAIAYYGDMFEVACDMATKGSYHLLILDEIMSATNYGFVDKDKLLEFLVNKPDQLEVVMTGRDPDERLCDIADYISEVKKVKHPFEKGIPARIGIEY